MILCGFTAWHDETSVKRIVATRVFGQINYPLRVFFFKDDSTLMSLCNSLILCPDNPFVITRIKEADKIERNAYKIK